MIFRPKITNTNPNTITNTNTEITNTNFRSKIFPFKITNQTQISDLWLSFFPFRNHKHKHKLTWLRQIEPRKKEKKKRKKKKNGEWGGVRPCHACGHGRGRWEGQRTQSACGHVCCGLVAVCVKELRDEEGEAEVWVESLKWGEE